MLDLNESIRTIEVRLENPQKTNESREREESYLEHLKSFKSLLNRLNDDMNKKPCPIYGGLVLKSCDVCQECLDKLEWNGDGENDK